MMIGRIISFLDKYNVTPDTPLLVSVSGGKDSMVLLSILKNLNYNVHVAHINHDTRNGGSDNDESLVEQFCSKNEVNFHSIKLNYQTLSKGNFQQNARLERKTFLENLLIKNDLKYILTAHHSDDNFETFMMNLNRGSGLSGLRGIEAYNPPYLRPLMEVSREEINTYQERNNIPYNEDESNASDDYLRNRIRHHLTPKAEEILPNITKATQKSTDLLSQEYALLTELVDKFKAQVIKDDGTTKTLDLKSTNALYQSEMLLYYILNPYGFEMPQILDIINAQTGAIVKNDKFKILKDRETLKIESVTNIDDFEIVANDYGHYSTPLGDVYISNEANKNVPKHLVLEDVSFPLVIRKWKDGDYFKPMGMKGRSKKIKKFLTDLKLSRFEKEKVMVLLHDGNIIQVISYRNGLYK